MTSNRLDGCKIQWGETKVPLQYRSGPLRKDLTEKEPHSFMLYYETANDLWFCTVYIYTGRSAFAPDILELTAVDEHAPMAEKILLEKLQQLAGRISIVRNHLSLLVLGAQSQTWTFENNYYTLTLQPIASPVIGTLDFSQYTYACPSCAT